MIPVIRTRFSVKSDKWPGFVPDKTWLDFRSQMLKATSYQSLLRQTRKDFIWLIEASPETYDYVKNLVKDLELPNAQALLSSGGKGEGFAKLDQSTQNTIPDSESYMLMRLDSDDVLHPKTVDEFCRNASKSNPIVGVNNGYKFNWRTGDIAIHYYKNSAFFGMLKFDKNLTFGDHGHTSIRYFYNNLNLINIPFVQVYHNSNVRVGFSQEDKKLTGKDIQDFYDTYGIKWNRKLINPTGASNPQVKLKFYLKYGKQLNYFYKLKAFIKNILKL